MIEVTGDIFSYSPVPEAKVLRCITTNGILKRDGSLVMGAGIAKEAADRYPQLPRFLGASVKEHGNHAFLYASRNIASFPTKHNWKDNSDLNLISRSCQEIKILSKDWDYVLLPRVGCALGGLDWISQVKPILQQHFEDDKFIIVTR